MYVTLLEKELERSILGLQVKCSLGCPWVGELRQQERHVSPSNEGDCPLVNVSCKNGCGQIMKRADEKQHEEETCTKRPIELQLVIFQRQMESKLEEMKIEYEKEIIQLKKIVTEQKEEIDDLKSSVISNSVPSNGKHSLSTKFMSLRPDVLQIMPKLSVGNIPCVMYYPTQCMVEIRGSCNEELQARSWLFRVEYQKVLFAVRSKVVNVPEHHQDDKLQDLIAELNIKYASSYVFVEEFSSRKKLKILSILPSQVDEIARLTETRIGSMRLNFVQLSEKRRITLKLGDITNEDVDVIVSATNRKLSVDTRGVASALNRASNGELRRHTERYLSYNGPIQTGDVIVTAAGGNLKCKHIFHFAGPSSSYSVTDSSVSSILQNGINKILTEAEKVKAKSIAIPSVGAGSYLLKNEIIASTILHTIKEYQFATEEGVTDIFIVIFNNTVYPAFVKAFQSQ